MKKKLFMILVFMIMFSVHASIYNNYDDSVSYANRYIDLFKDNYKYIVKSDNGFIVPFSYENGRLSVINEFKNGAFVNLEEYLDTFVNNESYLSYGEEYWTLTSSGNKKYYVTHNKYDVKDKSDTTGTRIVEQVIHDVKVNGKGTKNDPWTFFPKYSVTVKNETPSYGNVTATNEYVYDGDTAVIELLPNVGYEYESDTCSGLSNYSRNGNYVYINNVKKDIVCTFRFKYKNINVSYDSNGGSVCSPSSKIYKINDNYDLGCTPVRNGFNFTGWYTELNGGEKLTSISKVSKGENHSIYAHYEAKPISLSNQSYSTYYSSSQISFSMTGASGGSGSYSYTISGNGSSNFSIAANTLYIAGGTSVGTYTLTITVKDNISGATTTAIFTITISHRPTTTTRRRTTTNGTGVSPTRRTTTTIRRTTTTTRRVPTTVTTKRTTTTARKTTTTKKITTTRKITTSRRTTTTKKSSGGGGCRCNGGKNCSGGWRCDPKHPNQCCA